VESLRSLSRLRALAELERRLEERAAGELTEGRAGRRANSVSGNILSPMTTRFGRVAGYAFVHGLYPPAFTRTRYAFTFIWVRVCSPYVGATVGSFTLELVWFGCVDFVAALFAFAICVDFLLFSYLLVTRLLLCVGTHGSRGLVVGWLVDFPVPRFVVLRLLDRLRAFTGYVVVITLPVITLLFVLRYVRYGCYVC